MGNERRKKQLCMVNHVRNFVRHWLKHDITVPATSGFLRSRNEKTTTCTGRHRIHFLLQERQNHGRLSSFS
jgi:hypothetical protein